MKMPFKEEIADDSKYISLDKEGEEKTPLLTKGTITIMDEKSKLFKHFSNLVFQQ